MDLATAQRILADASAYDRSVFVEAYLFIQSQHIQGGDRMRDFWGPKAQPDTEPDVESAEETTVEGQE